ncbi:hypothetical protein CWR48_16395 [Oceanobacillus arenosus]|uniref:Ubiquitin-like domain-containing protein n=1 Tax=Oceanobacillus arenosus TaxID=1229153 RepID=A0A3D8PK53_9BACI|nr:EsaB/YukD family protein [Oceanobacillus arenosus]RDW16463.1 hypothetical protein CWR48_16395 [Oceanobacillus arenosus]
MAQVTHINVTMDFRKRVDDGQMYDLRIPIQVTVKQLLQNVMDTLNIEYDASARCSIKVITKDLLITDDDSLIDYPVTDGDILVVL